MDELAEQFRRWNNVPLSDLRGQTWSAHLHCIEDFEKRLAPWRRWKVRSNGRWVQPARRQMVKPIRGIHIRTRRA